MVEGNKDSVVCGGEKWDKADPPCWGGHLPAPALDLPTSLSYTFN